MASRSDTTASHVSHGRSINEANAHTAILIKKPQAQLIRACGHLSTDNTEVKAVQYNSHCIRHSSCGAMTGCLIPLSASFEESPFDLLQRTLMQQHIKKTCMLAPRISARPSFTLDILSRLLLAIADDATKARSKLCVLTIDCQSHRSQNTRKPVFCKRFSEKKPQSHSSTVRRWLSGLI